MTDTTVMKVSSEASPKGAQGQIYLATGKRVSMRMWRDEPPNDGQDSGSAPREYETVGYVISGRAELTLEGQTLRLEPGDSWLVPPAHSTATASWSPSPPWRPPPRRRRSTAGTSRTRRHPRAGQPPVRPTAF